MSAPFREHYYDHDGPWVVYTAWIGEDTRSRSWPHPGPYNEADTRVRDSRHERKLLGYAPYVPGVEHFPDGTRHTPESAVRDIWGDDAVVKVERVTESIVFDDIFECPLWWDAKRNRPKDTESSTLRVAIQGAEAAEAEEVHVEPPVYYVGESGGMVRLDVEPRTYPGADRSKGTKITKTTVRADTFSGDRRGVRAAVETRTVDPDGLSSADRDALRDASGGHVSRINASVFRRALKAAMREIRDTAL